MVNTVNLNGSSTFNDFRAFMGVALRQAKAPEGLVFAVKDKGNQGGGIPQVLMSTWESVSIELRQKADWENVIVDFYIHDMVLRLVNEYNDAWNYGPKQAPKSIKDPEKLVMRVCDACR